MGAGAREVVDEGEDVIVENVDDDPVAVDEVKDGLLLSVERLDEVDEGWMLLLATRTSKEVDELVLLEVKTFDVEEDRLLELEGESDEVEDDAGLVVLDGTSDEEDGRTLLLEGVCEVEEACALLLDATSDEVDDEEAWLLVLVLVDAMSKAEED